MGLKALVAEPMPRAITLVLTLFLVLLVLGCAARGGLHPESVDLALKWLQSLVGVLLLIGGGQQVAQVALGRSTDPGLEATPGIAGALAGVTLLGVGSWAAPVALGVLGLAEGGVRWQRARSNPEPAGGTAPPAAPAVPSGAGLRPPGPTPPRGQ